MVILEFNNIHFLKNVIVPLFTRTKLLNSKKKKDFNDFCVLVNIYYYGYHTIAEGESLAREIISNWNNFRLSNYKTPFIDFNKKYQIISNIPSPYIIKDDGLRFYRNTLNLVSDKVRITAIDYLNNE